MSEKYERFRKHRINVSVTPEEKETIINHAHMCNMKNISAFVRIMAIDGAIFYVDESERLEQATNRINSIGIQINKIAKRANETQDISKKDLENVIQYQSQIFKLLKDISCGNSCSD